MWFGSAWVLLVPSPKSHRYDATGPSGSLDVSPVIEQARAWQLTDSRAVGGWLLAEALARSTVHITALAPAESAVAVRPPYWLPVTGPLLSAATAQMWPPPVPHAVLREVTPPGRVQVVVSEELSAQYESAQVRLSLMGSVGVVWAARFTVSPAPCRPSTGVVAEVPL